MTTETQLNTLTAELLEFNGPERTDFNRKSDQIQGEIDAIAAKPAYSMTDTLYHSGGELDVHKALDADVLRVLTLIIDKAPSKVVRDATVSDFIKRINRCFKKVADAYAAAECKNGRVAGSMSYPNVGRSIQDKTPTTKWSTKELTWEAKRDKDGNVTGTKTTVTSASQSNNKGSSPAGNEVPAIEFTGDAKGVADMVAQVVERKGLSWDAVIDELTKVATLSKGHKVQFKREAKEARKDAA